MVRLQGTWEGFGFDYTLGSGNKVLYLKFKITLIATQIYKTDFYKFKITYINLPTPSNPNIIDNIINNIIVDANKCNFISEDATGNGINTFSLNGKKLTFRYNLNGSSIYGNTSGKYILYKIK